jgi:hypothetical protein
MDDSRSPVRKLQLRIPCQFGARSTHGFCDGFGVGHIEEGYFNDTKLNGLSWILIAKYPGEIAEGNGRMQAIID